MTLKRKNVFAAILLLIVYTSCNQAKKDEKFADETINANDKKKD